MTMRRTIWSCLILVSLFFAISPPIQTAELNSVTAVVPAHFPPQYQLDKEGNPTGFAIEMFEEVAKIAKLKVRYVVKETFTEAVDAYHRGEGEVIPNSGITKKRKERSLFTVPMESFIIKAFKRSASLDINTIKDIQGRKVVVVKKNVGIQLMKDHPKHLLRVAQSNRDALFSLLSAESDVWVYPDSTVKTMLILAGLEGKVIPFGEPLKEIKRGIRIIKGRPELAKRLDAALKQLLYTERYKEIYERWHGKPTPYWTIERITWLVSALLLLVIISMAFWRYHSLKQMNRELRRAIQEKERSEQLMRLAKEAAESANAELQTVSYAAAHNLRNPLRALSGLGAYLVEDYGTTLEAKVRQGLDDILASIPEMEGIIDGLLEMIRTTQKGLVFETVDLSNIAEKILARLRAADPERLVSSQIEPGVVVQGDAEQLHAALNKLLNNAWKFSAGKVEARIEFAATKKEDETIYMLRDNGVGFDMAYSDHLFQPFQRLHKFTEFPGISINLAIVQRIIARHGGRIWAQAEEGKGATFYFTLSSKETTNDS